LWSFETGYIKLERFLPKNQHKDWPAKKVTIFNTIVHFVKTSEKFWFFACILPDYVADEITKEF
jgi:hypothetical protein